MRALRDAVFLSGIAAGGLLLSGCMTRIMDFTVLSTKSVDIPGKRGPRVTGEDVDPIIIFIPAGQPNVKTAVDNALEKGNGDVLLDAVIYNKFWWIPYVYGEAGFVVEGTVLDTRQASKQSQNVAAAGQARGGASAGSGSWAPAQKAPPQDSATPALSSYAPSSATPTVQAGPDAPKLLDVSHPGPLSLRQAEAELLP